MSRARPTRTGAPRPRAEAGKGGNRLSLPPKLRGWPGLLLLAVVPAIVVGLVVYLAAPKKSSAPAGSATGIVEGFLRFGGDPSTTVQSFGGQLPSDFPRVLPSYSGSNLVSSYEVGGSSGTSYLAIYQTPDGPDAVLSFYRGLLSKDPWQIGTYRSSQDSVGVQFTNSQQPNIQGDISASSSTTDNLTTIYVAYQDSSALPAASSQKFSLPASKPLPPGFPSDIPLYNGKQPSTVIETYLDASSGSPSFLVSSLTKDDKTQVMDYYKGELQKRGWTVTDSTDPSQGPGVGVDFNDAAGQQLSGSIHADAFNQDPSYTRVDLLVQVGPPPGTPTPPAATPTP